MEHLNKIELKGRVGSIRTNEVNGNKVANFSVVTEYLYKTREGNAVSETTWFNIAAWNSKGMPDFDRITRGMPVYVSGRMRTSRYTTAEGIEKQYYEILATKIRFLTEGQEESSF
ncbi:MAG: single-stranded DNA-binding protein [Bacteroidales bacterium]|nr:single-stranded DNA-binding protein [Bacteroidales bacterium]